MSNFEVNPYAAPSTALTEAPPVSAPALWNPNAAGCWSALFSPTFGAYLQMRNWQALGEHRRAEVSWYWFLASIALVVAFLTAGMLLPNAHPFQKLVDRSGIVILLVWYFANGRQQAAFVKERFGKDYPRRGWVGPLAVAVACLIAFLATLIGLAMIFPGAFPQ